MDSATPRRVVVSVWRTAKVLFAAWAFAIAGLTIAVVFALVALGPDGTEWVTARMDYVLLALSLVGVPIMLRWLK